MPAHHDHKNAWQLLRESDLQSLDCLYQEHYVGLMNYGLKFCGRREMVRDSISQLLIDMWNARERLPEVENVRSYLITSLRRKLLKEISKERKSMPDYRNPGIEGVKELSYEDYLVRLQQDEGLKEIIKSALNKLSERQKEMLRLRFFEDRSYDEIAKQCGVTKRTAYNIVYDAIARMRKDLTSDSTSPKSFSFSLECIILAASIQLY